MFDKSVFCVILLAVIKCACAQVGDNCEVKYNGNKGSCKIATDCPKVEELAKRGISPTICGWYQLTTPIVCCEAENSFTRPNSLEPIKFPEVKPQIGDEPKRRISEEKCDEYTKTITSTVQVIPLITETQPIKIKIEKCEFNSVALIVGGKPAGLGEFPFMAAVGFYDTGNNLVFNCGGTLISTNFVLTAAHCTFSRDFGDPKLVRLGALDLTRNSDENQRDFNIVNTIVHPDYTPLMNYNDIALLKLDTHVTITKTIRPACLPTSKLPHQDKAVATGYGAKSFTGDKTNKLMKVSLNVYDNAECSRAYQADKKLPKGVTKTMLCAGDLSGDKDTCQGDSGGPLLVTQKENQCKFFVIGITSFGKLCGVKNIPAVYTRVTEYIQWIEDTVW